MRKICFIAFLTLSPFTAKSTPCDKAINSDSSISRNEPGTGNASIINEKVMIENRKQKVIVEPTLQFSSTGNPRFELVRASSVDFEKEAAILNRLSNLVARPILKLKSLDKIIQSFVSDTSADPYFQKLARAFKIEVSLHEDETRLLDRIPSQGPLIIVANHPRNGSDGMAIASVISKVRGDLKIVLTSALSNVPKMKDHAFFLDLSGSLAASRKNKATAAEIQKYINDGGSVLIFPAGEVSLKSSIKDTSAYDVPWKRGIDLFIRHSENVQVLPVYVDGLASNNFHRVKSFKTKLISEHIGSSFHLREVVNNYDETFHLIFGNIYGRDELLQFVSNDPQKDYPLSPFLRALTYSLKGRMETIKLNDKRIMEPVLSEQIASILKGLRQELSNLTPLYRKGDIIVYMAPGVQIPCTLQELGRLREINFRKIQEGSGNAIDLDKYDRNYSHLIAVDPSFNILGAYRLGLGDKIMTENGITGFYSYELFNFYPWHQDALKQSIELGRAFVNYENPSKNTRLTLQSIWKALGVFINNNPKYRYLFGPVSISESYSSLSKNIMIQYLLKSSGELGKTEKIGSPSLKMVRTVSPRNPVQFDAELKHEVRLLTQTIQSQRELNRLIQHIEQRNPPSLITSYDKLGGHYLAFNSDPTFNTVDGLFFISITESLLQEGSRTEFEKYLGGEGARSYLQFHQK